jgi:AcrR family transcriptional regulator
MRVSKEKAAENRERILKAAARLIRERGISGAGVDALTEAAGMTHGSLYSQFGSKERLAEEALGHALVASGKTTAGAATLDQYISGYLSPEHRDQVGQLSGRRASLRDTAPEHWCEGDVYCRATRHAQAADRPNGCGAEAATA